MTGLRLGKHHDGDALQADFSMLGSPNHLRVSWQFPAYCLNSDVMYEQCQQRQFSFELPYFDRFNIRPTEVHCTLFCLCLASAAIVKLRKRHRCVWWRVH